MAKITIVFNDTETTGTDLEDRILQNACAIYEIDFNKKTMKFKKYFEENINPPVPISPGSAAVHGLWYEDIENEKPFKDSKSFKEMNSYIKKGFYYCAHNSPFDIGMLKKENINFDTSKIIDTLAIARKVNKDNEDIESNGLQYLRYFYDFDRNPEFKEFLKDFKIKKLVPHTALSDIAVLAFYFKVLLESNMIKDIDTAVDMSHTPFIEDKIMFGNVFDKGTKFSEIVNSSYEQYNRTKRGIDYLNWAISNMESLSADIKISISYFTIEAVKKGELTFTDKAITPMKYISATFCPDQRDFLNIQGFNVDSAKEATIKKIKEKVNKLEKEGETKSSEYSNNLKLLELYDYIG